MKVLIFGNLTIDENVTESGTYRGVGGSSYFAGMVFSNFGHQVTVISPRGKDFPLTQLNSIDLQPKDPVSLSTLTFRNVMTAKGRVQEVLYEKSARVYRPKDIPKRKTDVVIVAPLVDNMDSAFLGSVKEKFSRAMRVFLPQGKLRTLTSEGKVVKKQWQSCREIVSQFHIIVYSREDMEKPDEVASLWSSQGTIVIVTKDKDGCSVYIHRKRTDIPGVPEDKIVDSTGAGDIFAASFVHQFAKSREAIDAAKFANLIASHSLRLYPNQLEKIRNPKHEFRYSNL